MLSFCMVFLCTRAIYSRRFTLLGSEKLYPTGCVLVASTKNSTPARTIGSNYSVSYQTGLELHINAIGAIIIHRKSVLTDMASTKIIKIGEDNPDHLMLSAVKSLKNHSFMKKAIPN